MKKKELNEIKNKSVQELENALKELRDKKLKTEVALSSGKEKNLRAVSIIRRDIAQISTLLRLAASGGQGIMAGESTKETK